MLFLGLSAFLYLLASVAFFLKTFKGVGKRPILQALTGSALASYIVYLLISYFRVGSFPVGDFHGTAALIGNFLMGVFLIMLTVLKRRVEDFGFLITFVGFLTTLLGLPATKSGFGHPLFILHLVSAAGSYAFIILGGITSFLKIFIEQRLKHKRVSSIFLPLNILKKTERVSVNLSFIFLTLTLIFGSLWTKDFLGRHWINDPKLIFTLVLWLYYAVMAHLNIVKGIKPSKFSYMTIAGLILSMGGILLIRHTAV